MRSWGECCCAGHAGSPFLTVDAPKAPRSPPGDRGQNMDDGAWWQRRVEPLQIAHVRPIDEDVDEWPQLACLQAEIEAQARTLFVERRNDLTHRRARHLRAQLVAHARGQRLGQQHRDRRRAGSLHRGDPSSRLCASCAMLEPLALYAALEHMSNWL